MNLIQLRFQTLELVGRLLLPIFYFIINRLDVAMNIVSVL